MTTIDLQCPVPWRQALGTTPARACKLDQAPDLDKDGSPSSKQQQQQQMSLFSPSMLPSTSQASSDTSPQQARVAKVDSLPRTSAWIKRRYNDTLWLGEHHSPLRGFLAAVLYALRLCRSPQEMIRHLKALLRTRQEIRERFLPASGLASWQRLFLIASSSSLDVFGEGKVDVQEEESIRAALTSGPGALVGASVLSGHSSSSGRLCRLGELWLNAIETRELQLQSLVILLLLRVSVEYPDTDLDEDRSMTGKADFTKSQPEESITKIENAQSPQSTSIKRKRKAQTAQRWTGRGNIFPWQLSNPRTMPDASAGANVASVTCASDAKSLSKRFESLVDGLCLRITTTNIGFNLDEEASENRLEAPNENTTQSHAIGNRQTLIPPFGSQGRTEPDSTSTSDVLQWFCCVVVEPHFSAVLPRQCGFVRSRCFVPNSASTVAPIKTSHKRRKSNYEKSSRADKREPKQQRPLARARSTGDVLKLRSARSEHEEIGDKSRLQRSLLDEGTSNEKRLQELQAARRRSTWDAREVSVRRRWDRSQSAGPGSLAMGRSIDVSRAGLKRLDDHNLSTASLSMQDRLELARKTRALSRTRSEAGNVFGNFVSHDGKERALAAVSLPSRESQILALDTPAKPHGSSSHCYGTSLMRQGHVARSDDVFDDDVVGFKALDSDDEDCGRLDHFGVGAPLQNSRRREAHFLNASPSRHRTLSRSVSMSSSAMSASLRPL